MSLESVMPSNLLNMCCPLLLLPSIFPSIRVFSKDSVPRIRWPNYWSISFNVSPPNEYSGMISFKIDWFVLHALQGTLKSLLQHHGTIVSVLLHSAFFMVQLSHPYMTTGKIIALARQISVLKVLSLLFSMLFRLAITFLQRRKRLLITWLQSQSPVILETKKIKSATISIVSPFICKEGMGQDAMILVFWMSAFPLSSFTFIQSLFSSSSLSAISVESSAYLRLLIFLPAILIPACASSSLHIYHEFVKGKICKFDFIKMKTFALQNLSLKDETENLDW